MEIYTHIELNQAELDRQFEILGKLQEEGWEEVDRREYFEGTILVAVRYRLKRIFY